MSVEVRSHNRRSWANLPLDLLLPIADRLDITSIIRLSAVRTSWTSRIRPSFASIPTFHPEKPIPWLLISSQKSKTDPTSTDLTFYNLVTATSYSVPLPIPYRCIHHWRGSNKNWVVTVDQQSHLHLIKPLTGAHVPLPVDAVGVCPRKVILCRTPDCFDGFYAITINAQGQLVYTKPGVWSWIPLSTVPMSPFLDVVFHKGKLYALALYTLSCWDLRGSFCVNEWITYLKVYKKRNWWTKYFWKRRNNTCFQPWIKYLVEWKGELLIVLVLSNKDQLTNLGHHKFGSIELYKIELEDRDRRWSRVRSLGGDALFLGANYSYAVSACTGSNVRGNCIYIAAQLWNSFPPHSDFQSKCGFGVYDLKKGTYKPCHPPDSPSYSMPPIWFWPC